MIDSSKSEFKVKTAFELALGEAILVNGNVINRLKENHEYCPSDRYVDFYLNQIVLIKIDEATSVRLLIDNRYGGIIGGKVEKFLVYKVNPIKPFDVTSRPLPTEFKGKSID